MDICVLDPRHGGYVAVESTQYQSQHDEKDSSRNSSPSSSTSEIFSVVSDISSQSSQGDYDDFRRTTQDHVLNPEKTVSAPVPAQRCNTFPALPGHQLQNPRRSLSATKRIPPPLPRQEERKLLFVNDLVDSATNLVSVIWPLSGLQTHGNKGILPLRNYIEETLRRSRTSYSTLQVALYYLILVKSHVPCSDLTAEQGVDRASVRTMQCGRRMFLAALILASKYLQDRNYSAKAWSKMSGLKATEINSNERAFLSAVNYKLHIPENVFNRWTEIVLQITAQPGLTSPDGRTVWSKLLPFLSPSLDDARILALSSKARSQSIYLGLTAPAPFAPLATDTTNARSEDSTPTPSTVIPRFLEPTPEVFPPTPGLARMGPLPTPAMTPYSVAASTPAVSACSSRRPSMSMAMSQAQNNTFSRMTQDRLMGAMPRRSTSVRSNPPGHFLCSSPESMVSDATRTSRSSSISSVSTAPLAAPQRAFARPANSRINSNDSMTIDPSMLIKNPAADLGDFSIPLNYGYTTLKPISISPVSTGAAAPVIPLGESRKRCRPQPSGDVDTQLQNGVRSILLASQQLSQTSPVDARTPTQGVPFRAVQRAMTGLSRSASLRAPRSSEPTCAVRRAVSTYQHPIVVDDQDSPRKRFKASPVSSRSPDIMMSGADGVWHGIA